MSHCVSVGTARAVAVDEVNGFVYFGQEDSIIRRVKLDGSSIEQIFSAGKLHLHDFPRVVMVQYNNAYRYIAYT